MKYDMSNAEEERVHAAYARRNEPSLASRYSSFDAANLLAVQELEWSLLRHIGRWGSARLAAASVCDVGCGTGYWLREFIKWGAQPANLAGIDLLPERIARARETCPPSVQFECGNADRLPWPDASFDIVTQFVLFTSILDGPTRRRVGAEMLRILKPDGMILWYDFHVNNPRNPDVRGVPRSEIHDLFPKCHIALERITLAPPISRRVAARSVSACRILAAVPFLCTHYLGVIRKRSP